MNRTRMRKCLVFLGSLVGLSLTITAQALPINPATGLSGTFFFGGTGDIGSVQTSPAEGWQIGVGADSLIDVRVDDCCVIGDEFALLLDGVLTPWTSSNPGGGSLFFGQAIGLLLTAGTHQFDFRLTDACCSGGGGSYRFSPVREARVSEPSTVALISLGLLGIGISRRRRVRLSQT